MTHRLVREVGGAPAETRVHPMNRNADGTVNVRILTQDGSQGAMIDRVSWDDLALFEAAPDKPPPTQRTRRRA